MEAVAKRLLWRCRRGMLELDMVLQHFVETHYARLTDIQMQTLNTLLDLPDNDLWDLVTARTSSQLTAQRELLGLMRTPLTKNDKMAVTT